MKKVVKKTISFKDLATKADVNAVKADVRAVKKDVNAVKADVLAVKNDLNSVKIELNDKIEAVNEKIGVTEKILREEIRLTAEETIEKMDEKSRQYRDQILTKFDQFLGEIVTARQERVLINHHLNNHEERLVKLESKKRIPAL